MTQNMKAVFFRTQAEWRKWLGKNHSKKEEILVGYYKKDSGKPGITWPQSVDEALCFGWIDGVRKSIDKDSYVIRFTPRKPKSIWSAINIEKVEAFKKLGQMMPAGIAAYEKREEKKSKIYSYEKQPVKLDPKYEQKLKANKKAWEYFQSQIPSYQKVVFNWVMSAKQEATRISRLNTLINDCEAGVKIKSARYGAKKWVHDFFQQ